MYQKEIIYIYICYYKYDEQPDLKYPTERIVGRIPSGLAKGMKRNPSSLTRVFKSIIPIHNWLSCQHKLRRKKKHQGNSTEIPLSIS
jgi:hypothetical protein